MAESAQMLNGEDTSWVPMVDMKFKSDEDAYQFYNNYARVVGFSVRRAWINRRTSGVIISRTYVCYKEGYQGNKKDESEVKKPRENERTGCFAHMTIKIASSGEYRVTEFHPMHNHELVPPAKSHLLKSHQPAIKARAIEANVLASQKTTIEYLVRQAGGYRQVTFVSVEDAADKGWAPKIDMEFENDEKAHLFYWEYAKRIGFDVRKAWVNRKASGIIISRTYVCYKEGYYGNKKDGSQERKHPERPNERTGCQARMIIKLAKNGRYRVTEFQPLHNHEFVTARMAHTLKSLKVATKAKARPVVDDSGMASEASHECVDSQDAASVQYNNYLPSKRKDSLKPGDVGALMQYMQDKQADDPSLFYAIQLDKEEKITNVFWADGKSAVDYEYFGDVICLDTTYKTTGYGRPLAPFYGVNHHRRIVFFGAALLYDENEESFKWLFDTFKNSMHGRQPKVVLTVQDEAITKAIATVWQGTVHRFCAFHVYNSAAKYLSQIFQGSRTFACDLSRCVYDFEEEEEFISAWEKMLDKYELKDNEWLKKLFEARERWAAPYGREVFCADINSIQRRENLNSVLKECLSPEQCLLQYLKSHEKMVDERRHAELHFDFRATRIISMRAPSRMLRQAASVYTPAVLKMFQREFEKSMDCMVYNHGVSETIFEYTVTSEENPKEYLVRFNSLDGMLACGCKKFEFMGIQCCHVLKALDFLNIKELPPQYFLKRWRKDAMVGSFRDGHDFAGKPKSIRTNNYLSLCRIFNKIAAMAAETVEGYTFVENQADQLMDHVHQILQRRPPEEHQFT